MIYPEYFPVLDSYRSGNIDNRFFALVFLYGKNGLIKKIGNDSGAKFYLRSLFKPIQASVINPSIIDKFGFDDKELAVMQSSHAGESVHLSCVKSILDKINLSEDDLLCPKIPPLNTLDFDGNCSKIHNNCSGKHSMMLSYCVYNGLDIKSYTDFNHPCQLQIKNKLIEYAKTDDLISTKDGCTVPVYGLSIDSIANAFLNYYADSSNSDLINAYRKNPYIIGGSDNSGVRTDTKIMQLSKSLISKVGAGGFIYVYNPDLEQILIIKMSQDNNFAREIIVLELLYRLNWLDFQYYDRIIRTEDGEPVGEYCLNGF